QHALAARLEHAGGTAGPGKPEVDGELAGRDVGVRPVPHDPAGLVLVESEVEERADEVAGLRDALGDDVRHLPPDRGPVPSSALSAYRKHETTSRVAASPMPSTGGSFAV